MNLVDLVGDSRITTGYTAQELGVSSLISNGSITDEACEALVGKINIDFGKVLDALLYDCSYAAYWFDKTRGASYSLPVISATSQKIYLKGDTIEFYFSVSKDYTDGRIEPSGMRVGLDTSKTGRAKNAYNNAVEIAGKYTGLDDKAKMKAFKNKICDLVTYDYAAIGEDYGDSYQLVNVFDNDPSTNVVCEGYSKAFLFLCQKTDFQNYNTSCKTVTGTMDGGAHMWNVVTLKGSNYLVDVTNCDTGTIGAPDHLFFAVANGGTFNYGYKININDSVITYEYDRNTVAFYGNDTSELMISTSRTESPDPEPCNHTKYKQDGEKLEVNKIEPTCTESGYSGDEYCTECMDKVKR